jgi:hypothetical protein
MEQLACMAILFYFSPEKQVRSFWEASEKQVRSKWEASGKFLRSFTNQQEARLAA